MRVFRKNFLHKEGIGIIPSEGYRFFKKSIAQRHTMINFKGTRDWTSYYSRWTRVRISVNRGHIHGRVLWIQTRVTQRHVLQFHGFFFHGCPICYRINCEKPMGNSKETFDTRYKRRFATICGYVSEVILWQKSGNVFLTKKCAQIEKLANFSRITRWYKFHLSILVMHFSADVLVIL